MSKASCSGIGTYSSTPSAQRTTLIVLTKYSAATRAVCLSFWKASRPMPGISSSTGIGSRIAGESVRLQRS